MKWIVSLFFILFVVFFSAANAVALDLATGGDDDDDGEEIIPDDFFSSMNPDAVVKPEYVSIWKSRETSFSSKEDPLFVENDPSVGYRCSSILMSELIGADPEQTPAQIVGWAPRFDNGKLGVASTNMKPYIHHMDLFACSGKPVDYTETFECGDPFAVPECGPFISVYDKGAGDYALPENVGISIGKGTGYTWALLQIHYLATASPHDLRTITPGESGFKLWIQSGRVQREHNARFMAMMDTKMKVPPSVRKTEYTVDRRTINSFIADDLKEFGSLTIFGGHLHAHDLCTRFELKVRNGSRGPFTTFAEISHYGGYGKNQTTKTFATDKDLDVSQTVELTGNQEVSIGCEWKRHSTTVVYGTGLGEEMCGPVLMYYPTLISSTVNQNSAAFFGKGVETNGASVRMKRMVQEQLRRARERGRRPSKPLKPLSDV